MFLRYLEYYYICNKREKYYQVVSLIKKKFIASLKEDWGEEKYNDVFVGICGKINGVRVRHPTISDEDFRKLVVEQYTEDYAHKKHGDVFIALVDVALDTILIE